jgi:phosphoglycolate phosphatase
MLQWLLDKLGVKAERALMIGDTSHDMAMAQAAGVNRLGIAHGAHDVADLLGYEPLACVRDCAELRTWLANNA